MAVVFAQAELMTVFWFQPWKTNCHVILVKTPQRGKNSGFPVTRLVIFHNKKQTERAQASCAPTWHEIHSAVTLQTDSSKQGSFRAEVQGCISQACTITPAPKQSSNV